MSKENNGLLTPKEAQAWLEEHGLTHRAVAKRLGVKMYTVRDVLYGRNKGTVNDGHAVAVALRIKAAPRSAPPPLIPVPRKARRGNAENHQQQQVGGES